MKKYKYGEGYLDGMERLLYWDALRKKLQDMEKEMDRKFRVMSTFRQLGGKETDETMEIMTEECNQLNKQIIKIRKKFDNLDKTL